jgi:hypothetical protein
MDFDLRKPLGAMFTILGVLLVGYGLISSPEVYERSFNINVNLIWGAVMLVFGGTMLWLGRQRPAAGTRQAREPRLLDPPPREVESRP